LPILRRVNRLTGSGSRLSLLYARALLVAPASPDHLHDADEVVAVLFRRAGARPSSVQVGARLIDACLDAGIPGPQLERWIRAYAEAAGFESASTHLRQVLQQIEMVGRPTDAVAIALELAQSVDPQYARLAHRTALRCNNLDAAQAAAAIAERQAWMTPALRARLAVERRLAAEDVGTAIDILAQLPQRRDAIYSRQFVRAHAEIGRYNEVLEHCTSTAHGLDRVTAKLFTADALRWLDRTEESTRVVLGLMRSEISDRRVLARLRDWGLVSADGPKSRLTSRLRQYKRTALRSSAGVETLLGLYWELGWLDHAERVAKRLERSRDDDRTAPLRPATRMLIARIRYLRRQFNEAIELIEELRGTPWQSDAEKLRARIMLERGDVAGALANRQAHPRPVEWMDGVSYVALLHQRRYDEAFSHYPTRRDRARIRNVFGDRAEVDGSAIAAVASRLVIAQAGPGDEINLAGTYHSLRERSDILIATCDPRLVSLLRRSFPDIEFVAVTRLDDRRPGGLGPESPPRSGDTLFPVLTAQARDRGLRCDGVVLAKTLHHLTLGPESRAPYSAYLQPRPELVERFTERWPTGARTFGIVWRSELTDSMRRVHYLTVPELTGLFGPDDVIVCLQHDATTAERRQLVELGPAAVDFVDGSDLRNDFETMSALVASLDAVVGVGTTMTELSGAVGTPTILLQPTHIGSWRATDGDGHDFWHQSTTVAVADPPWDHPSLIRRSRAMLDERLPSTSRYVGA
jgi:hypothetical protein